MTRSYIKEMTLPDRYDTGGNPEGQFESGSNGSVLLNKLGIHRSSEMDDIELELLEQITIAVFDETAANQQITTGTLCEWHRRWLGNVYLWAGQYRSVNMSTGEFSFAAAHLIPQLMQELNDKFLSVYTPCDQMNENGLIDAMAITHIELILVHPFRDGNGRIARLLANVMALQAGQPALDFSFMDSDNKGYITAIHAGLDDDEPMKNVFRQVLHDSLENAAG